MVSGNYFSGWELVLSWVADSYRRTKEVMPQPWSAQQYAPHSHSGVRT
jgi:hypothetical protein